MLSFEQACRRIRKHHISVIFVETGIPKGSYGWYAGENGVLTNNKAGAYVHITPRGAGKDEIVVCRGDSLEEAVEKYCKARGLSS